MYKFLLSCWKTKKVTAEKLQTYVPLFITQEEVDRIILLPQNA